ncbi:MAG: hypothetical protein P1U47_01810 [Zhongshania sp.]|uniref:hypothetical protein n=1 Tax=Zhongshania sp. TaxID=1971902 RepID=UPI002620A0C7|nr:hypothetical protein [Zhongshania sp.]MDF1691081.1 hypothetical protein [Zhongshania sp.]
MIDLDDYRLAWQVYLGVGVLAMVLWFLLLRRIPSVFVRYWLLFAALAFLFVPGRHPAAPQLWVPGSAAAVLSLLTEGIESAMPILISLGAGQILALIMGLAAMIWLSNSSPVAPTPTSTKPVRAKSAGAESKARGTERKEPSL